MKNKSLLSFTIGNAKLPDTIATFSLPAGHSCPGACSCLAKVVDGKLVDGPKAKFRCFSASAEALFRNIRESRQRNFDLLKEARTPIAMAALIQASLPFKQKIVRIHVSGDFYSQAYFDAWLTVASQNSDRLFYAYTKSLPFWIARLDQIPPNFRLTASRGGKFDALIEKHDLPCAEVVFSKAEAEEKNLKIDHDDRHAMEGDHDFALLIHGNGKPGSLQAKLQVQGRNGYKADYFAHKRN